MIPAPTRPTAMIEFLEFLGRLTILVLACVTAFRVLRAMFLGNHSACRTDDSPWPREDDEESSLFGGPLFEAALNPIHRNLLGNVHHDDWDE